MMDAGERPVDSEGEGSNYRREDECSDTNKESIDIILYYYLHIHPLHLPYRFSSFVSIT